MFKNLKNIGISLFIIIFLLLQTNIVLAHGGEDHGDEKETPAAPVINTETTGSKIFTSEKIEVLVKYPELHTNIAAPFQVFVTEFQSNKPLNNANVSLYFESEGSNISPIKLQAMESNVPGIYQANVTFEKNSDYRMLLGITKEDIDESFSIERLSVENAVVVSTSYENPLKKWLLQILLALMAILFITAIYLFNTKTKTLTVKDAV